MERVYKYCLGEIKNQHFTNVDIGIINFKTNKFESIKVGEKLLNIYDLASVSKPLNLASLYFLKPKIFTDDMKLLLNHRASLPAWGRVDRKTYKKQINSYLIKESNTLYSDFSALRLMFEIEKKLENKIKIELSSTWDKETLFWKDLKDKSYCVPTGFRNNKIIQGEVHDDNSFIIKDYTTHAGMFSTINGLCKSFINLNEKTDFIKIMLNETKINENRFVNGWDTVKTEKSLAGSGCSKETFGHLGFTGTSVWIDPKKEIGHIILTNETIKYWYDRTKLNKFRREIGRLIWSMN